ncbi:PD-(D/E)XK nuclease family protein [Tautonia sp. JC769]|uniref:PD-(D/E)XK nuclease family protein n=1 Tax=Tautonia sp. JC769 TaxID=3232135 RepID=UPI003457FF20
MAPGRPASDRVYCWDDLWHDLRADDPGGPFCPGPAGVRAALRAAIEQARQEGALSVSASVADSSGFRRRVSRRIARWMAAGRAPSDLPPPIGAVEAELRAVYRCYQEILGRLGAVDEAGLRSYYASWLHLTQSLPRSWGAVDRVVVVEPPTEDRPVRLAIDAMRHSINQLGLVLTVDRAPDRAEVDAPAARFRERMLAWGFLETSVGPSDHRPAGLAGLDRHLFREGHHGRGRVEHAEGLALRGASTGEGLARVAAAWARDRLGEGEPPEELLILVRSWDEQASIAVETLRSWGLSVSTGRDRPIGSDAAVQALKLAMSVPVEDWDTDLLGRLLRNGRIRPRWDEADAHPMALAASAAAIREARVYRGRDAIAEALGRMVDHAPGGEESASKPDYLRRHRQRLAWLGGIAVPVFRRLAECLNAVAVPGPWAGQVDRLAGLAIELGLDPESDEALGHLFGALDDHAMVLDGLGRGDDSWTWADFVAEVQAILRDLPPPASSTVGAIRFATVDEAAGVLARHILLTNLAEGTFPNRSSVGPTADPDDASHEAPEPSRDGDDLSPVGEPEPPTLRRRTAGQMRLRFDDAPIAASEPTPFGREMARFLRVLGAAEVSLTLAYPTSDEKGVDQLAAGFLVEVETLLSDEVRHVVVRDNRKLDPALRETAPQSPPERRVRAMARAAINDPSELAMLATIPEHRERLRASASALLVNERRSRIPAWKPRRHAISRFEGMLRDPRIIDRLASEFGPSYTFSASQLESLAFCPFQFYLRYVLRLDPIEERDELEEDRTAGGSLMHAVLESLHLGLRDEPPPGGISLDEAITDRIERAVRDELEREARPSSDVGRGLRAIEAERMARIGKTYADQFRNYAESLGRDLAPEYFEFSFGDEEHRDGPALVLGEGDEQVRLQGMIDRIDLTRHPSGLLFRVIDYKTGSVPSRTKLEEGLALQLPLYAMAVERALPAEENPRAIDAGYWALRGKGYAPLVTLAEYRDGDLFSRDGWKPGPDRIVRFVLDLVDRLRRGMMPAQYAKLDCERNCDYRTVCRFHQVRQARKPWAEAPSMSEPGEEDLR